MSIEGIEGASVIGETSHTLNGGEVRSISLRVRIQPALLNKPSTELDFRAEATDKPSLHATSESRFMKPL